LGKFISKIRALRFDVAIDFEQYYRLTGLIMWLAHIPYRVGFDISGQGRNTMLTTKVKYNDTIHEVENFGRLVETIGATKPTQLISPVFKSASADAEYIKRLLSKQKTVVIHPGTSSAATSRRWPAKNFAKLADALAFHGYRIIFTGADEEKPIIKKIILASQQSHTNLVGKTSLSQLLELFKQVKLVISLDTGPLHLAASTDTPVLGLYGANTPIKWGPYGRQHKAIYHGPFPPCTQQQYGRVCNHKEEYHMQNITSNEVLDTALNMLKTKS
jgi:lipopolysaccharide heptosyltransferase II